MKTIIAFALVLLSGCGQPVCFMGAGDCSALEVKGNNGETQNGTAPYLEGATKVARGNILILDIKGGKMPYKSCSLTDNKGGTIELIETNKCKYTPPNEKGFATAHVTDSNDNVGNWGIIIE